MVSDISSWNDRLPPLRPGKQSAFQTSESQMLSPQNHTKGLVHILILTHSHIHRQQQITAFPTPFGHQRLVVSIISIFHFLLWIWKHIPRGFLAVILSQALAYTSIWDKPLMSTSLLRHIFPMTAILFASLFLSRECFQIVCLFFLSEWLVWCKCEFSWMVDKGTVFLFFFILLLLFFLYNYN